MKLLQYFTRLLLITLTLLTCKVATGAVVDELRYISLDTFPLLGTLAADASARYSRLPDSLKERVRPELWNLGLNSAGLAVRFRSDSPRLAARWHSHNKFNMNHMTATGIRGLDLYVLQDDSTWTTVSSARPSFHNHNSTSLIVSDMEPGVMREYMLYLSLYDGVDSLYIGVDSTARVLYPAVELPKVEKPIVMYGTSILQGGCATRPGMAHTNIIQRDMQRQVINLGFSGNARLDPEIAHLIAQSDPSAIVLDMLPNCTATQLDEYLGDFVAIIRKALPTTPILLIESPIFPIARFNREVSQTLRDKNNHLFAIYQWLQDEGYENLHYMTADKVLGDRYEATVDNYHLTDAGFDAFAKELEPILDNLINN